MKKAAFLLAALVATNVYAASQQTVLSNQVRSIELNEARYVDVPTQTTIVEKPCSFDEYPCWEEVVVSSKPMVRVYVSYVDPMLVSDGMDHQYVQFDFDVKNFPAADVAKLKEHSKPFEHVFSNYRYKFAQKYFTMTATSGKYPVKVVDMSQSRFCAINSESGEKLNPNCQDYVVYKTEFRKGSLVTVSTK
jgi:hypothetical protein